jgi:hypothetical protein
MLVVEEKRPESASRMASRRSAEASRIEEDMGLS